MEIVALIDFHMNFFVTMVGNFWVSLELTTFLTEFIKISSLVSFIELNSVKLGQSI